MKETEKKDVADILLVDDKLANLVSLEEVLKAPDLNFIKATSGEAALEAILKSRPALILLDVQMPGMNGFEVARLLRGMKRTCDIPIIFVTATHREEKFSFEGFESGAVDYLYKPLNPIVVRSKVRVFVELHRKSVRLEQLVQDLSLINHELESFSYSVSHDLKAPVRSVIGFAQHALEKMTGSESEKARQDLLRVVEAGEQMNRLIHALLDLARISRFELVKNDLNLSALVQRICAEFQQEAPERKVELQIAEKITDRGDEKLLEIALRNLISNAFKFTSKNDRPRIEFGMLSDQAEKVYFIRDNGAGFDMTYANKLFGTFQRLHTQSEFSGTGVGLATVRRIIHRHGGKIWAESAPQKGATFYFTL